MTLCLCWCFCHGIGGEEDLNLAKESTRLLLSSEMLSLLMIMVFCKTSLILLAGWLWLRRAAVRGLPFSFLDSFSNRTKLSHFCVALEMQPSCTRSVVH